MRTLNDNSVPMVRCWNGNGTGVDDPRTRLTVSIHRRLILLLPLLLAGCSDPSQSNLQTVASISTSAVGNTQNSAGANEKGEQTVNADSTDVDSTAQDISLQMLADLVTPDTVAVLTAKPNACGSHWEPVANAFGLPGYANAERVSLLIAAPGDFTLPALTGSGLECSSDTAFICQFASKDQTDEVAAKFLSVDEEYTIPHLFLHGTSESGVAKHVRSLRIQWMPYWRPYGDRELLRINPSHDVSVLRADDRTIVVGATRLLFQMGTRRKFLPLRKQLLASSPINEGGLFINLANGRGWLASLLQDEISWARQKQKNAAQYQIAEDHDGVRPDIQHASVLSAVRDISIGWDTNATQPLTMHVTFRPNTWLQQDQAREERAKYLAEIRQATQEYGMQVQQSLFFTMIGAEFSTEPLFVSVGDPEDRVHGAVWKLACGVPPFEEISARRGDAMVKNSLKQIGIALHQFHEVHRCFPAAVFSRDRNGNPLLSWRVALLPYLNEAELYNRFKLDEPWDSPHNIQLLSEMPSVYGGGKSNTEGNAGVLAVAQVGSVFDPSFTRPLPNSRAALFGGTRFTDVTDGTSNTLAVVFNPDHSVPWTKPEDLPVEMGAGSKSLEALVGKPQSVGLLDGSTSVIPATWSADSWRALILRSDGKQIPELE